MQNERHGTAKFEQHSQQMNYDGLWFPAGLRHFVYYVAIFTVAQALEYAFLTSWEQGGYSTIDTVWANAALLLGVVLLWFFCKMMMR